MKSQINKCLISGTALFSMVFQVSSVWAKSTYSGYDVPTVESYQTVNSGSFGIENKIISVGVCTEVADHEVSYVTEEHFFTADEVKEKWKTCHTYCATVVKSHRETGGYVNPDPSGPLVIPGSDMMTSQTESFQQCGETVCRNREHIKNVQGLDAKSSCESATAPYRASCKTTNGCLSGSNGKGSRHGGWENPYETSQPWVDSNYPPTQN
jgi:hypothetical protein